MSLTVLLVSCLLSCRPVNEQESSKPAISDKPNIVFFLTDDHRYDCMGFLGHPFLKTPGFDRIANEGVFFKNAFVTTSLSSPSRASILTGLYAHQHRVVDNYHEVNRDLIFFPQYLQKAGYETAFLGKWHMGNENEPQRGFDHWAAFRGQGTYYPDGHGTSRIVPQINYDGYNINGKKVPQKGYITDELTDMSLDWMNNREHKEKPFFLYVSHKGVHSDFVPRDEDRDMFKNEKWTPPADYYVTPENRAGKPKWVNNQRNSRHGSDYGYNLEDFDLEYYYKRYCEALVPIDDAVSRTLEHLEKIGELDNTLFVYMGDNGFFFGEHGLIDKRAAYETSMRVPLLMKLPKSMQNKARPVVSENVANIDIAPTLLEAAGIPKPKHMHGESFLKVVSGEQTEWRESFLYEYFWEWNYPQTPTTHALRDSRYKYIRYHGIWDTDELYDIKNDPEERYNLINLPEHKERVASMKKEMFKILQETNGNDIPFHEDRGRKFYNRNPKKSKQGEFPEYFYDKMLPVTE
ncbi:MAG: sulfatase [Cyclobacteriaceae bacterium]